jgi:hypothetical protein
MSDSQYHFNVWPWLIGAFLLCFAPLWIALIDQYLVH